MKKILIMSSLLSMITFSSSVESALEEKLLKNYQFLGSGMNLIKVQRYDVDVDYHKIDIKIELQDIDTEIKFNRINLKEKTEILTEIANYSKKELKKKMNVQIIIEFDMDLKPDQILHREII